MVLAGAGSGKTRVLTHRAAYLISQGIDPTNLLLVTFTNKAAREMKERVGQLVKHSTKPQVGTFHATGVQILRRYGHHLGLSPRFLIYDKTDQISVIKQVLKRLKLAKKNINPSAISGLIGSAKCELVTPREYQQLAQGYYQELAAEIYPLYQELLRENEALDFGDLIMETVRLLKEHQEVREAYQRQFAHLMVDEYQDTNHAQYEFTKLLVGVGDDCNLCVVGDCSQSIYAFRGANLQNILDFKKDFPRARVFNLEKNYRSTKTIIDTATRIIQVNKNTHPVLSLWTDNPVGKPIVIYTARDHVDEAQFVVFQIQKLRDYDLNEFAVLYRTNAQSRVLEEVFLHAQLPYRLVGGIHFYERKEIKDILAYLKYIANPKDKVSFGRIVNTPPRGIGPVTLRHGGDKLDGFEQFVDDLREKSYQMNVLELLEELLKEIDFKNYLDDGTEMGIIRWENVLELKSVAQGFTKYPPEESLWAFLESVALMEKSEVSTTHGQARVTTVDDQKSVNLMTLHAAKGLEFSVVFIVGLEEGLLPHSRSLMERSALEEERRLVYVGVTRAKEQLFLTHAQSRLYFGQQHAFPPSRFLKNIPEELIVKL